MTIKDKDRRLAFWISFVFVVMSPFIVKYLEVELESVKASAYALTTLGIANYFSKPSKDL